MVEVADHVAEVEDDRLHVGPSGDEAGETNAVHSTEYTVPSPMMRLAEGYAVPSTQYPVNSPVAGRRFLLVLLVPKLLFGNALSETRFRPSTAQGRETEFRRRAFPNRGLGTRRTGRC